MREFIVSLYDNIVWFLALCARPYEKDDHYDLF